MFAFLKRVFRGDEAFFDLIDASATEARQSACVLAEMLRQVRSVVSEQPLKDLADCRRRHKRITQEITERVCRTFVTPLEREDLEALSGALYKISKAVEKIAERVMVSPLGIHLDNMVRQVAMLEQATETVLIIVKELRSRSHVEKIQDDYQKLQTIEGDADKLMVGMLRDLYQGASDAREVIILKDLYELLESAIDQCRNAGNVLFEVMLKYS